MDIKKAFENKDGEKCFIKTTIKPVVGSEQKAALNRRGNVLFNSGDIENARRIYQTTGYSDGLSRVGDYYKSKGYVMEALRMYWMAPDRTKFEPIIMQLAIVLQGILHEEERKQ